MPSARRHLAATLSAAVAGTTIRMSPLARRRADQPAERVAVGFDGLVEVDRVRDLPAEPEGDAERDHVLLRQVELNDRRRGAGGDDALRDQLVREVPADADDELGEVADDRLD